VAFGCPCPSLLPAPGGLSAAPAAVGGGVGCGSLLCIGGVYGWLCLCCWFVPWCRHYCPAVVLRLGVGPAVAAFRRWLVAGSGLPVRAVRAVRLVCAGFRLRARRFGFRLAGLGSSRFGRLSGVRGLRPAGSGFRGQSGVASRVIGRCRPRGLAAGSVPVFAGGARCLVCPALWRWPVRGFFPRPVPRWWCGWRRIWPPRALRLSWVAALAPMRRCCRRFPVPSRPHWCGACLLSALAAQIPAGFRRLGPCPRLPVPVVPFSGGQAARLRFRFGPAWLYALGRWSMPLIAGWWCFSLRQVRAARCWLAAAPFRRGCRWWLFRSVFRP
jgi:hypothetical protein